MAIALSQINAHDGHVFPVGFICSWKQLLWCNSLMEPAASCTMPTLLQSSSQWVVPSQWNGCDCDVSVHGTIALTIVQWWCSEIWRLPILQWKWTVWALHTILSGPGTKPRLQFQSAAKATFPSTEPASVLQQPLLQTTSIGGNYAMTLIWWPLWFGKD